MTSIADLPRQTSASRTLPRLPQAYRLPLPAAIYLITVITPIWFTLGPLSLNLQRFFLLFMTVPLLINLFSGRYGRILPTDILFVCFLVWMGIGFSITTPDQLVTLTGSLGIEFIGGYLVGRAYINTKERFFAMARWLAIILVLFAPLAIFEALTGRPLVQETLRRVPSITTVSINPIDRRMGLDRVQGFFVHPIHFGLFASVAFSLYFVGMKNVLSPLWRWLGGGLILLNGFLALSSGALLAIFMQLFLILWATVFANQTWRWRLLLALAALAYIVVDLLSNRSPLNVFMSYATFSAHNAYWRSIIFEWGLRNVLGSAEHDIPSAWLVGIGMADWVRPEFMRSTSVDNFWLVLAMRHGIPGFLLCTLGCVMALFAIMFRNFDGNTALLQIRRAWVFTFIGLSFTLATVHVWSTVFSFVFFVFGAGMWLLITPPQPAGASPDGAPDPESDIGDGRGQPAYSRYAAQHSRRNAVPIPPLSQEKPR